MNRLNMSGKGNKKGQIEVFGLAVIVILITIGFFIYVSIKSQEPKSNIRSDFINDRLANDFVLSILDVNVAQCNQYTVKDLVVDCAKGRRIECGGVDSCIAANRSINYMLNKTFTTTFRYKYRFYSEGLLYDGVELMQSSYGGCTAQSTQGQRGVSIISKYPEPGNIYLNMNICY